jgi:hypothetical protein
MKRMQRKMAGVPERVRTPEDRYSFVDALAD